jgi:hypothetical protein
MPGEAAFTQTAWSPAGWQAWPRSAAVTAVAPG